MLGRGWLFGGAFGLGRRACGGDGQRCGRGAAHGLTFYFLGMLGFEVGFVRGFFAFGGGELNVLPGVLRLVIDELNGEVVFGLVECGRVKGVVVGVGESE